MHFVWFRSTSLRVLKFVQLKEGGSNFRGEPVLQNVLIIWYSLLYFNFKSFLDPNSSSFIRFQSILHESGRLFSETWNFYKLKSGDLVSGGNQFGRMSELFRPPFCISILKVLQDPKSALFIRFQSILNESGTNFSESWNLYKLKTGHLISGANQFCRMSELFDPPFQIQFQF